MPFSILYIKDDEAYMCGPFDTEELAMSWAKGHEDNNVAARGGNVEEGEFDIHDTNVYLIYPSHKMQPLCAADLEVEDSEGETWCVAVKKSYSNPKFDWELTLCGEMKIKAPSYEEAEKKFEEMRAINNANPLQTNDPRIVWEENDSLKSGDWEYIDFSFGLDNDE